jgi:hypothetical protein
VSALVGGIIAGLLFAWLSKKFVVSPGVQKSMEIRLPEGENILFHSSANHFRGIESVGGTLYQTNKRLIFKSHKFNIQNHQLSIELEEIEMVESFKSLGLWNNGILVKTKTAGNEKFVVEKREEWQRRIKPPGNTTDITGSSSRV